MTNVVFSIKNEEQKDHIKIINDVLIKNELLDKTINSFFVKSKNETFYLVSSQDDLSENDIFNNILTNNANYNWLGSY